MMILAFVSGLVIILATIFIFTPEPGDQPSGLDFFMFFFFIVSGAIVLMFSGWLSADKAYREKLIEHNHAHYVVDEKTGETEFIIRECEYYKTPEKEK